MEVGVQSGGASGGACVASSMRGGYMQVGTHSGCRKGNSHLNAGGGPFLGFQ